MTPGKHSLVIPLDSKATLTVKDNGFAKNITDTNTDDSTKFLNNPNAKIVILSDAVTKIRIYFKIYTKRMYLMMQIFPLLSR